ncbi:hypothetical protein ASC90_08450 [Rhizobium sp. Root1220]|nr:hypothetical protein ASC90_08450 [Rhizobium sp. Root1220]
MDASWRSRAETAAQFGVWREAVVFLLLVALLLIPLLINGFPLVMDDSIAYSGEGVGWIRSNTAAVVIAPLYNLLGYWALPLFNAVLVAAAWLLFCRSFAFRDLLVLALPLSVLALLPLYVSAVLVDTWFFAAIVFLIVAVRRKSPLLAILVGILFSSHGSGLLLVLPFSILMTVAFRRWQLFAMPAIAIVTLLLVNGALERKYFPDVPRLGETFLASRLFSIHPELLRRQCQRSGDAALCIAADYVAELRSDPANAGRRDFFWDVARRFPQAFQLVRFERYHARPIIVDGLTYRPVESSRVILGDFLSFYGPETLLDFIPVLTEPMPAGFYQSAQGKGLWQSDMFRHSATVCRYALYLLVALAVIRAGRALAREERIWVALLLLMAVGNDLLFAIVSGPPDRYHHRILPLLGLVVLLATNAIQRGRVRHLSSTDKEGKTTDLTSAAR